MIVFSIQGSVFSNVFRVPEKKIAFWDCFQHSRRKLAFVALFLAKPDRFQHFKKEFSSSTAVFSIPMMDLAVVTSFLAFAPTITGIRSCSSYLQMPVGRQDRKSYSLTSGAHRLLSPAAAHGFFASIFTAAMIENRKRCN